MSWIHTIAFFGEESKETSGYTEEQIELLGIKPEMVSVEEDFSFDTSRLIAFNRSDTPEYTTIWLEDNPPITIQTSYEDLKYILEDEN